MEYQQLSMSNQDAEWLASRRFTIDDIARMFNVSPILLQEYSNSTYSNFSEASRAFLTITMRPWFANFEQQIKSALLMAFPKRGIRYRVEFDKVLPDGAIEIKVTHRQNAHMPARLQNRHIKSVDG
ncbi:Putative phage head portal protein [Xenorhabdus bovienii]|uniref:Putative phage head portal protein n=1 Tax=Xenorhabdus bovienii TaxID=40576 RepID=A0A0B6X5G4_XENBV|nr:Putative phage head portal protein [Xenorhabdus bovienii]